MAHLLNALDGVVWNMQECPQARKQAYRPPPGNGWTRYLKTEQWSTFLPKVTGTHAGAHPPISRASSVTAGGGHWAADTDKYPKALQISTTTTTTTRSHHMNIATAYQLGENARKAKESRAPSLNPQIRAWLTEHQPEVGDPHTRNIFDAFVDGYRSAEEEYRTN